MNRIDSRHDLYTVIHKALRGMLFDVTASAAKLDVGRAEEIDELVAKIERAIGFLNEHAEKEDRYIMPALHSVAPEIWKQLSADHLSLEELQRETERAAHDLGAADVVDGSRLALELSRVLNRLTSAHLAHMNREETEANPALWGALGDTEVAAIHAEIAGSIPRRRLLEWREMALPSLNPVERRMMAGGSEDSAD